MTTAGDPLASLGPRYAPEDPTLPKPWKGLVDGTSGVLYYWNPESNITQYERPANLDPTSPTGAGIPTSASAHTVAPTSIASSLQTNVMPTQHGQEMSQIYQSSQGQQMFQQNPGQFNFKPQHQSSQFVEDTQHQGTQMTLGVNQQGPQMAQGVQQNWQSLPQQSRDERVQQPVQRMPQHFEQQTWKHFGEDTQFRGTPITQEVHQQGPNMSQGVQQNWQSLPQQSRDEQSQQSGQRMPQHLEQKTWPHFNEDTQYQGPPITQEAHQQDQKNSQGVQQNWQPLSQHSRDQLSQQPGQQMPQYLEQQTWQHEVHKPLHMQGQQFSSLQPHVPFQGSLNMQGKQMLQPLSHQGTYQQGQQIGFSHRGESEFQQGKENGFSPSTIQQPGASFYQHHLQTGNPSVYSQQYGADSVHQPRMGRPMFHGQSGSVTMHGQQPGGQPLDVKMGYGEDLHGRPGGESYFDASKRGSVMVSQQLNLATSLLPQKHMSMEDLPHLTSSHGNRSSSAMTHNAALVPPPVMRRSLDRTNLIAADVYRREHEVTATGDNVPAPFMTFEATGFPPEILREIHFAGFTCPTPIQAQTWPISLQSRDIVAIAKTGSGKTLGYLVPAFLHLRQFRTGTLNGPRVLILAPTRELATQIQDEAIKFGRSSGISCTCLYGGAPKGAQIRELDRGVDIVVATPGRLNDILEMRKIDFRQVSFLVLDEADRMLDMGFEPQIRKIVNEIPPRRQTLMYTATWPKEVRKIAADLLVNPVQVNIGRVDELAANKAVKQYVEVVLQMNKHRRLEQILRSQEHGSKVIIFCSTKRLCDQLTHSIGRIFGAAAIHGDKSQGERDHVLNQFRNGKSPILVATDVAARGLDIKDVRMVINYDFPTGIEDYVHRIGRTGRAGATGVAYTFFSDQDRKHAADLVKVLEGANQTVPPELLDMTANGRPSFVKNHGEMPGGDSGGGRMFAGGRGGMRDGNFAGRGGMRDGSFAGHGAMRDGNFAGHGGMRDSTFTGRSGQRDDGFGGYRGRDDFGGHGNRGRGFSGTGRGPGGWGRHDSGPREHHNNDRRGQYGNRRGLTDGSRGKKFRRNYSRSPDMVSTWDTRSSSSDRSRSRSRSRNRSRSRSRSQSRSRSRSIIRNHARSRNRSCSRSPGSSKRSRDQDHLRSERVDPPKSKIYTPSPSSLGDPNSGKLVLSESSAPGGSIDENSGKLVSSESSAPGGSIDENSGKLVLSESSAPGGSTDETKPSLLPAVNVEHNIV